MKFKIHKCLECRCEYRCIGQHVQIAHKMSPKDYYDKHLIDPHLKIETKATASKMKCIKDNNVVLLSNSELKFYIKFVKKKYGSEYIKQFKKKQFYE